MFSTTITFVVEIAGGGAERNAHTNQYQRWHCLTPAIFDSTIKMADGSTFYLDDNVQDTDFKTEITFFERANHRYPTMGSVALVTGKFFLTKGNPEPRIKVRAEPIRVYVVYNSCALPLNQHS